MTGGFVFSRGSHWPSSRADSDDGGRSEVDVRVDGSDQWRGLFLISIQSQEMWRIAIGRSLARECHVLSIRHPQSKMLEILDGLRVVPSYVVIGPLCTHRVIP